MLILTISTLQQGSSEFTSWIILQLLGLLANQVWLDFQQKQSWLKAEMTTKEANMILYQHKSHRSLLSPRCRRMRPQQQK